MNNMVLRKVQLVQLEILTEVKRVCEKNDIKYFLDSGTLLGAIRHQGFIPWDDDLDIGMLREDYDKFCKIALKELNDNYILQTWLTDEKYPLPFGKVRKKGTIFVEGKSNQKEKMGIYIDIFPYDYAPIEEESRTILNNKLSDIYRIMLMKNNYQPWYENGKIDLRKRMGYIYYQIKGLFKKRSALIAKYESLVREIQKSTVVYEQTGQKKVFYMNKEWFNKMIQVKFEDGFFDIMEQYDKVLKNMYDDYMVFPDESERENRHQILQIDFGNDENS